MCFHVKLHIFMQMSTLNCVDNPIIDTNMAILYNFKKFESDNVYIGRGAYVIGMLTC